MTDIETCLDGKPLAAETHNHYRVARAEPKPTRRRRAHIEAQADRLAQYWGDSACDKPEIEGTNHVD